MTIRRYGNFTVNPASELYTQHMYRGSENRISVAHVFTTDFTCEFKMELYPFDSQTCYMLFTLQVKKIM